MSKTKGQVSDSLLQHTITNNIRIILTFTGTAQSELANVTGLSPGIISRKMRCKTYWSLTDLEKISQHFRIPIPSLVTPNAFINTPQISPDSSNTPWNPMSQLMPSPQFPDPKY